MKVNVLPRPWTASLDGVPLGITTDELARLNGGPDTPNLHIFSDPEEWWYGSPRTWHEGWRQPAREYFCFRFWGGRLVEKCRQTCPAGTIRCV
jgi:hypothetical protein